MATGTVKVFNTERNFGFLTTEVGDDLYVPGDGLAAPIKPGDIVEYEVGESENGNVATDVTVVKPAPEASPVGRTMAPPPDWDTLEERERQRRAARRRRR
jgi:cold shock CspA family protein